MKTTKTVTEVENGNISSELVKRTRAKFRSSRNQNGELNPEPVKPLRTISSNMKARGEQTPLKRSLRISHSKLNTLTPSTRCQPKIKSDPSGVSNPSSRRTRKTKSRSSRTQNGELDPEPVKPLRTISSNMKARGEQTPLKRSLRISHSKLNILTPSTRCRPKIKSDSIEEYKCNPSGVSNPSSRRTRKTKSRSSRTQNGELDPEPAKRLKTISSNWEVRGEQTPLKLSLRFRHSKINTLTPSTRCQPKIKTDGSGEYKFNSSGVSNPTTSSRRTRKTPQKKQPQKFLLTGETPKKLRESYTLKTNKKTLNSILSKRSAVLSTPRTSKVIAMVALHTSKVLESLPCRHKEYETIYNFLSRKIKGMVGGFMYIYGIPGTGKTATVERIIKQLQSESNTKKMKKFTFVEINGMHMTRPQDAYCQIWKKLENYVVPANTAKRLLQEKFNASSSNKPLVLLIDEFDMLFDRTLSVVDTILDWIDQSKLIVLAIANSKDLIEEMSKGSTKSRMFRERLCDVQFKTYTFDQLEEIIHDRLKNNNNVLKRDAVQLLARKSAISGDVRLALNLCRRVLAEAGDEVSGEALGALEVNNLLTKIYSDPRIDFIASLSRQEQTLLRAIRDTILITNSSTCSLNENVYKQYKTICVLDDLDVKDEFSLLGMLRLFQNYGFLSLSESLCTIHTTISLGHNLDLIQLAFTRQINKE